VWDLVAAIPYGTTVTYGSLAARMGLTPGASRAIGGANGSNPLPIVVPCHRVIGADGTLTGYAGGLPRKQLLLQLEGVLTGADQARLFDVD
jgi:methylated-DNA-[protein]-cysteine S-methyltransferase